MSAVPTIHVSYWAKPNRYAAECCLCGAEVPGQRGWTWGTREPSANGDGKRAWVTTCHRCAVMNSRSLPEGVTCRTMNGYEGEGQKKVDIHSCSACDRRVGLVKSKAGKWYLCEINEAGRTKAQPWRPHKCEVDYREDEREQYEKEVNAYQGEQA